ncbi:MAG: TRAP transporter small permease [Pseudomonadota bacterium]
MAEAAPLRLLTAVRRVNGVIGLLCGLMILGAAAMILVEIVARQVAFGLLGGTDEISGYVMAGIASWAAAYALVERAHIRIDLMHRRLPPPLRAALDIASLLGLLAVSLAIVVWGYGEVALSYQRNALANTPLETPLWIPQSIWLAGWVWFGLAAAALSLLALAAAARGDWPTVAAVAAPDSDEAAVALDRAREDAQ